jgi:hypothetical protein
VKRENRLEILVEIVKFFVLPNTIFPASMKILASRIAKELKKAKHCAVYEPELRKHFTKGEIK